MITRESVTRSGWPVRPLSDLVEFLDNRRKPVTEKDRVAGPYIYYGANGPQGTIDQFIFDEPTILVAEDGGYFGQEGRTIAYQVEGKYWVNNHAHVLRPKAGVDIRFLCRHLEHYDVTPFVNGTTRGKLTKGNTEQIPIALPPLAEQKRIAAVLDKADDLRCKRRQALATLDTLLQSVFLDMFGNPVTNPKGWPKMTFEDVAPSRLGKMLDAKQQTGDHGRPYLRNISVQWNRFDLTDVQTMDFDGDDREQLLLASGDLMICEGGEPGRCAIWRDELPECYFQKALHRARPHPTKATPEYLLYLMWSLADRGGFKDHVTVATIAHLTGEKLKRMLVPVPPVSLQRKFSDVYSKVRVRRASLASAEAATDTLFTTLQSAAFAGTLFNGQTANHIEPAKAASLAV